MAGEVQIFLYTTINHVVAGASLSSGDFSATSDVDAVVDNTANLAPQCNLILTATFGAAPASGDTVDVYRQDLQIAPLLDEPTIDAGYTQHYVGSFTPAPLTSSNPYQITGIPLPPTSCNFILQNNTASAALSTWNLDVQPYTYIAAP